MNNCPDCSQEKYNLGTVGHCKPLSFAQLTAQVAGEYIFSVAFLGATHRFTVTLEMGAPIVLPAGKLNESAIHTIQVFNPSGVALTASTPECENLDVFVVQVQPCYPV